MDYSSAPYSDPDPDYAPSPSPALSMNYNPWSSYFASNLQNTYAPPPPPPSPALATALPSPSISGSAPLLSFPFYSIFDHYPYYAPPPYLSPSALSIPSPSYPYPYPYPYMYHQGHPNYARSSSDLYAEATFLHSSKVEGEVQRFRVKLLAESTMDVLCQVGLDGIQMLDPSFNTTLRIYPLGDITRFDVADSSTFAFWFKRSVDLEPGQIRLQSNTHTTNALLYSVIAATEQFKEMGGRIGPSESVKTPEHPVERKKGFTDWMSKSEPVNEERDHWVPDEAVNTCSGCGTDFGVFVRKHHCRECGYIFCGKCTHGRITLTADENAQPVRVCDPCMAEVNKRLKILPRSLGGELQV